MCNQSQGFYGSNNTLSPAAQAVLDAYEAVPIIGMYSEYYDRLAVAAALRAAADLVVPVSDRPEPSNEFEYGQWLSKRTTRGYLLAIAAELENN